MGSADLGMAPLGDPPVELLRGDPERLAEQDPEVVGAAAWGRLGAGLTLGRKPVYLTAREKTGHLSVTTTTQKKAVAYLTIGRIAANPTASRRLPARPR